MASGEGVTTKELEEALKTRLSAVHTEVADISGYPAFKLMAHEQEGVANRTKWSLYDAKTKGDV